MKKKLLALVLAAGMVASMAACGNTNSSGSASAGNSKDTSATAESTDSDLAYVKDKGTLVVGITDFEPMDYQDENGNWIGFDADLASAFAESLGVDVEFVEIDWDNKILELDGKTIDCVWNGMTLTDEVTSSMSCTTAYCNNAQVVVVPSDVADKYQDKDSLKDLTFAVESGSAGEAQAPGTWLKLHCCYCSVRCTDGSCCRHIRCCYHRFPDGRRNGWRRHRLFQPDLHHWIK